VLRSLPRQYSNSPAEEPTWQMIFHQGTRF
jgi:hypothetical protein